MMLRDVLDELNNTVAPMYQTWHYEDPTLGESYVTRVHIRVDDGRRGKRTISAHDSSTPMATYRDAISSAARRALWSLCHTNCQDLEDSDYQHLPRRAHGTEDTELTLGGDGEGRVNVTVRALAAVNTDQEHVTNQLDETQDRLRKAHHRIRQLEAQLAGEAPPTCSRGRTSTPRLVTPAQEAPFRRPWLPEPLLLDVRPKSFRMSLVKSCFVIVSS